MLPRSIIVILLLAIVTALPVDKQSSITAIADKNAEKTSIYSALPLFSIFKPIIEMFPNFSDIGPKIEVGDKFTNVIVKAKNYKIEDLSVKIKDKFVLLQGRRKTEEGDRDYASEFLYTTSLPEKIDSNDVYAKLYSDGYLVVTTPNEGEKEIEYVDREVPIVVTDELFIKPVETVNVVPVTTETVPEVTTVPATLADVTDATTPAEANVPEETTSVKLTTIVTESTTDAPEITENETLKTEDVESTTPYIEVVTLNTTPFSANEVSDLEPVSDTN